MPKSCLRKTNNDSTSLSSSKSSSSSSSSSSKKDVRWHKRCKIRFVHSVRELQGHDLWYDRIDFKSFREEREIVVNLVQVLGRDRVEQSGSATCLGMERLVCAETERKVTHFRYSGWNAVLDEQERQDENGTNSPGRIARAYKRISQEAQLAAQGRAQSNAVSAGSYQKHITGVRDVNCHWKQQQSQQQQGKKNTSSGLVELPTTMNHQRSVRKVISPMA